MCEIATVVKVRFPLTFFTHCLKKKEDTMRTDRCTGFKTNSKDV